MVRIVFGPSVAISVVVSAQLATGSARAPKASNSRVIDPNPRTSLLILLPARERRSRTRLARANCSLQTCDCVTLVGVASIDGSQSMTRDQSKRPSAGAAQLCGVSDQC